MNELVIQDLACEAEGNPILKGVNLTLKKGDVLALLGPNGHGKSTLLNVLMGSPDYVVTGGSAVLDGEDLFRMSVSDRSRKGMFLAFQNPPDVPGVVTMDFFRAAINSHQEKPVSLFSFYKQVTAAYQEVGLDSDMASRHLNEGYSGGEKKRNEILQMVLLNPSLALLDEIDSGLDVDALNQVAQVINALREKGTTFVIISHYDKLYELVKPTRTAVMVNGRIAVEGDASLANRISREGYSFLEKEYHVSLAKEEKKPVSIGVCGVKQVKTPTPRND
jgi:Fe-S cluster assembly ATP-binding protein